MAEILPSRAKVVLKSGIGILLFCLALVPKSTGQVAAPSTPQTISLQCRDCSILSVLEEVEKKTGLHFIYSTNVVAVGKQVSIHMTDKPLDEFLNALSSSLELVFKRNGQHVVIKSREVPVIASSKKTHETQTHVETPIHNPEKRLSGLAGSFGGKRSTVIPSPAAAVESGPGLAEIVLKKPEFYSPYFDLNKLPDLPSGYLSSLNLRSNHPGWFISAGFALNNYSAGMEFYAGLRSVFLVYKPSWLNDGRYHGGYGVGTSMVLHNNLSWNTVYSYAAVTGNASGINKRLEEIPVEIASSSKHHQLRLMLQYALTKNISLQGGLSVNLLETTYDLPEPGFSLGAHPIMPDQINPNTGAFASHPYRRVLIKRVPREPVIDPTTTRMWIGWETSLSYRFNFFRRR